MNISYAFTSGRLETIYKISNQLQFGDANIIIEEQLVVNDYRERILSNKSQIEETELYKKIIQSECKILQNRLVRALKENSGSKSSERAADEYKNGVWHELKEYKLSARLVDAKNILAKKYHKKTGMNITSRDISEMTGINSNTLRNMLAHKRDVVVGMLEKFEKFVNSY